MQLCIAVLDVKQLRLSCQELRKVAAIDLLIWMPVEDQITHEISLDSELDRQLGRDIFKEDPEYEKHEQEYEVGPDSSSISGGCDTHDWLVSAVACMHTKCLVHRISVYGWL